MLNIYTYYDTLIHLYFILLIQCVMLIQLKTILYLKQCPMVQNE